MQGLQAFLVASLLTITVVNGDCSQWLTDQAAATAAGCKDISNDTYTRIKDTKPACACWFDLAGTLMNPAKNKPYKCACCPPEFVNCGAPKETQCVLKTHANGDGCVGVSMGSFHRSTLSEVGFPCHFNKTDRSCAWCTSNAFQCTLYVYDDKGRIEADTLGRYCRDYTHAAAPFCWGNIPDCRSNPGICHQDATCKSTGLVNAPDWTLFMCQCNTGFFGNGIDCLPNSDRPNYPGHFISYLDVASPA